MPTLTLFMYTPHYDKENPYLVYSVDCTTPEKRSGYMQGYWKCTHCGEGNQFRFYDDTHHPLYLAKCPSCKEEFIAKDDTDWDD